MKETIIWNVVSLFLSGIIAYYVAKCARARAKLTISLEPQVTLDPSALGNDLGIKSQNLAVFKLTITTGFVMGITSDDICEGHKPAIMLDGLKVRNVITVNNNSARFDIPIARVSNDTKLILNMNWVRRNTRAEFQIVGELFKGMSAKDVKAVLYPGLMKDIDVRPKGLIAHKFNEHNFRPVGLRAKVEIHG